MKAKVFEKSEINKQVSQTDLYIYILVRIYYVIIKYGWHKSMELVIT